MKRSTLLALFSSLAGLGAGCGQTSQSAKPPPDTAAAYRQQAAKESAASDRELTRANAANAAPSPPNLSASGGNNPQGYYYDLSVYNVRNQHLARARELSEHAHQHEVLAAKLESFEEAECKQLPPSTRAACPLLGPVSKLVDLPSGVQVEFAPGTRVDAVLAHMRCHLAFAQAQGFEASAAACPLYVRGIEIRAGSDGRTIDILSGDVKAAREIQARAREEAVLVRAASN